MFKRLLLLLVVAGALAYFTAASWAPWIGTHLVDASSTPSRPADAVVVLAGDFWGYRVVKGGELVRQGFAPISLVSGASTVYGLSESRLAIDLAVREGFEREKFEAMLQEHFSTEEEATRLSEEISRRGLKRVIVVTSNYHTRRSGRIWRRIAAGRFEVEMVSAPDKDLEPATWWMKREGRKKIFFEWTKAISGRWGL